MTKKTFNSLFIILLIICSINFFELQSLKGSLLKYLEFSFLLLASILSIPYAFQKPHGFIFPVQLISFSILISMFISTLTREQGIVDSLGGTIPVLIWFIFFYLKHIDYQIENIEKIVVSYGIIYLIFYFFQFTHPDKAYFIDLETLDLSRGIVRIVFPGRGIFYLTIFISINKLTTNKQNLWFWAFLSTMGIIVTIMQVTRQFIFATFIIYLFHFLRDQQLYKKLIVVISLLGILIYITQSNHPIVEGLRNTQDQTMDNGSDDVRVRAATFFLTDFSNSIFNRIFGNGVPYGDTSSYMTYITWHIVNYGFWLADVGLVGVYVMFGVFAVLGYVLVWIKSFIVKLPKKYFYLKYYLWFLLLTCLTSDTIYSPKDLIATVLVVYIYQAIFERERLISFVEFNLFNNTDTT